MSHEHKRLPLKTAIYWILLSTFLISGSSFLGFLYYLYVMEKRTGDDKYNIIALVQTCPDKECLKTVYLAELLNLSVDRPSNLYRFNLKEALTKLLDSPLIKAASIQKMSPGTVYVDYTLRTPIAFLGDYTNTAIDQEGYALPFKPFFTPKKLPVVVLGESSEKNPWGKRIKGRRAELALSLLHTLAKMSTDLGADLLRLDVSKAFSPSYGQRQIVVIVEEREERVVDGTTQLVALPTVLRLSVEGISQQLANYLSLRSYLLKEKSPKGFLIELRIPELAFIAENPL